MGKGSKRRPTQVSEDELQDNWDRIFNRGKKECYQCEAIVDYLFPDGRCSKCTRLTPEDVQDNWR